jgi:DDE superfamily endonuclease
VRFPHLTTPPKTTVSGPPLTTLVLVLQTFSIVLTKPSFQNLLVVVCGWLLTQGPHAVTEALVMTGVAGKRHHEAFHRFFSRARWDPDDLGRWLFHRLLPFVGNEVIQVAIDDTLAPKKGPHVFGIASHLDAVRSTRQRKVFSFGHVWVVLAVVVRVPFSERTWALPVLFRLYRSQKETATADATYEKKTELANELLQVFARWVDGRRVEVALDMGDCNSTVLEDWPSNFHLCGAMRSDAKLTAPPGPRAKDAKGRPKLQGDSLPKPCEVAEDESIPWEKGEALLYGKKTQVQFKTFCAQWYSVCGVRRLRIVVVRCFHGQLPFRVFFSTDFTLTAVRILELYAGRWAMEVFFREAKQQLGFADSLARLELAVRRVAPLVGLLYTVLVVWFLESHGRAFTATPPVRPWYPHKSGLSFADILREARAAIAGADILTLAGNSRNLKNPLPADPPPTFSGK